ncbi:DUF6443 domain-containing protein [Fulvivirga ulvae]|uniref:DUF6443 domain-containing protein n=1 Tax=Fulvivirga ulvae TaxID=2904245 RepID=UPI001F164313|nr:DUF6443 domain-containing protein [Fulvivirga ulvae]UII34886.1 DUF6443 domain-containing protein [Fulvivirga ulvae]
MNTGQYRSMNTTMPASKLSISTINVNSEIIMKILSYIKYCLVCSLLVMCTLAHAQETAAPPIDDGGGGDPGGGGGETYTFAIYSDKSWKLMPGTTARYWVHDGTVGTWDVTGGTKISQNSKEVTVKWGTGDKGKIIATGYLNGGIASGQKEIDIIQPPKVPYQPEQLEQCNGDMKHYMKRGYGSPESSTIRWYWQIGTENKNINRGFETQIEITPSNITNTFYLQAYDTETGLWSARSTGRTAQRYYPDISGLRGGTACGGTYTLYLMSAEDADKFLFQAEWYNASTNDKVGTGRSIAVPPGSYYAKITTKYPYRCFEEKTPTVPVHAPTIPSVDPGEISGGGNYCSLNEFMANGRHIESISAARITSGIGILEGYEWYISTNSGTYIISGQTNPDLYVPANLPVDAENKSISFIRKIKYTGSCNGQILRLSASPVSFNVYDRPEVASATVDNQCGQSVISMPQSSGKYTYYWQTSATGTETTDTREQITVLESDARKQYYLRARHNLTLCWNLDENTRLVTANPKVVPAAEIIDAPQYACPGSQVTLNANVAGASVVYWENSSNETVGSEPELTVNIQETETFTLHTRSDDNCTNESSVTIQTYPVDYYQPNVPLVDKISNTEYRLMPNNSLSGFYYYWLDQGIDNEAGTRTVTEPGKYILKALNSDNCEVGSSSVEVYDLQPHLSKTITNPNYVRTFTYLKENVTDVNDIAQVAENTQYLDGLGRTIQVVDKQATPQKTDLVMPQEYDAAGNMPRAYLPYKSSANDGNVKNLPYTDQHDFYNAGSPATVAGSYYPFAFTEIERAPTQRANTQHAPGESWTGEAGTISNKGIHNARWSNAAGEVLLWRVVNDEPVYKDINGAKVYYAENMLFKIVTTDEQKHKVIEYTDKEGKTILKKVQAHENGQTEAWADTYYIYDDFGNLRFVLPPMACKAISEGSALNDDLLIQWAFQYKYDARQRMIAKRVPGADWVYMVYDVRDRLVLTQDGEQRADGKNEWAFTKYDQLDRPVLTGITDMGAKTTGQLRTEVAAMNVLYEQRGTAVHGYTNNTYPAVAENHAYLTATYYDDYSFVDLAEFGGEFDYRASSAYFKRVKGLVTGSKIKGTGVNAPWVLTATYYDNKYRVTLSVTKSEDLLSNHATTYDFAGRVLSTSAYYPKGQNESLRIDRRYEYDHAGRLLRGYHKLTKNNEEQEEVLLAENQYNELGELIEKNLHVENSTPHQSIDYRYNIRGWLQSVNNSTLLEEAGVNVNDANTDLFGMELMYNNLLDGVSVEN